MDNQIITPQELDNIKKYFGDINQLDIEEFKKIKKQLQAKYHPDNFEKFEDETIKEMATERFQEIENLASKVELILNKKLNINKLDDFNHADAQFSFQKMKIEIQTRHKDLKYHIFGSHYRWLAYGESYTIPKTKAQIITDESHQGTSIGYSESIRMYLTFGVEDAVELITLWLFTNLNGRASSLIIEGKKIDVDLLQINNAIKQKAYVGIEAPKTK